jgi:hypothetical protein
MSITVELPPEIEAQVRTIPNLDQRVLSFLRSQVEHEKWREQRYSEKARSIVREGLSDTERMKTQGVSREEMFQRLFAVFGDGMTDKMAFSPEGEGQSKLSWAETAKDMSVAREDWSEWESTTGDWLRDHPRF